MEGVVQHHADAHDNAKKWLELLLQKPDALFTDSGHADRMRSAVRYLVLQG